jgi:hypothetical protein
MIANLLSLVSDIFRYDLWTKKIFDLLKNYFQTNLIKSSRMHKYEKKKNQNNDEIS